jgi:hypothetical protein
MGCVVLCYRVDRFARATGNLRIGSDGDVGSNSKNKFLSNQRHLKFVCFAVGFLSIRNGIIQNDRIYVNWTTNCMASCGCLMLHLFPDYFPDELRQCKYRKKLELYFNCQPLSNSRRRTRTRERCTAHCSID